MTPANNYAIASETSSASSWTRAAFASRMVFAQSDQVFYFFLSNAFILILVCVQFVSVSLPYAAGLTALAGALNKSAPPPEPFAPVSDLLASSMLPPRQQQAPTQAPAQFQNTQMYGGGAGQSYSNAPGGYNSAGGTLGSSGYGGGQNLQSNNSAGGYNYGQTPTQQPPPPPSQQPYSSYNSGGGGQMAPSGEAFSSNRKLKTCANLQD